jgi:hypothetical protein
MEFKPEIGPKREIDRSVTVRSNWGWAFVCNKSEMSGWVPMGGTDRADHEESGDRVI